MGTDVTPESDVGLWTGGPGAVSLYARKGDFVPGSSTMKFGWISTSEYHGPVSGVLDNGGIPFYSAAQLLSGGQWEHVFVSWTADAAGLPVAAAIE